MQTERELYSEMANPTYREEPESRVEALVSLGISCLLFIGVFVLLLVFATHSAPVCILVGSGLK